MRRDLRLEDNPALQAASATGAPFIPVFVNDENEPNAPGTAARWWLSRSLEALQSDLKAVGSSLVLRRGDGLATISRLADETNARAVYWNRRYFPPHRRADEALAARLNARGVETRSFNAALMRDPGDVRTTSGAPYRVFSPFWKALRKLGPANGWASPRPRKVRAPSVWPDSHAQTQGIFSSRDRGPEQEFEKHWTPGEAGAHRRLDEFLDSILPRYARDRDRLDADGTSRLSPHLAFGEISPARIWRAASARVEAGALDASSAEKFLSELGWREFSYALLHYNEGLPAAPLRAEFAGFPWRDDQPALDAWRKGETGYPVVDAGMRQLLRTGWMHNRARMVTASFLVKHLLVDWRAGAAWFLDTLVDADLANNSTNWQWVAGCGTDAAPYFRIFNPVVQGEKFDPDGRYVRTFVPDLSGLPCDVIHKPWTASADQLQKAGVLLGETYPSPIVDHAEARQRALDVYAAIRRRKTGQ